MTLARALLECHAIRPVPEVFLGNAVKNWFIHRLAQEHQPDAFVAHCANQLAMMMEPSLMARHRTPGELLAQAMQKLYRCCAVHAVLAVRSVS